MADVKISVIIPVYNAQECLESCLDSLIVQRYPNVEYICVDDGSTDSSLEICQRYAERDERFVVIHKENGGPSSARNLAIREARGEYLCFVDSDDMVLDGIYEKLSSCAEKTGADLIVFGAKLMPDNPPEYLVSLTTTRDKVYDSFSPSVLFDERGMRPFLWMHMVRKSIITDNGFKLDEEINLGEDQLFQFQYIPCAKKIVCLSEKLYVYRWCHKNSLMSNYAKNYEKKILAHADLTDRILSYLYGNFEDPEMRIKAFEWSIFFMWGDIPNLFTKPQTEVAVKLMSSWERIGCMDLIEKVNPYAKERVAQISLMASGDFDYQKKIENYKQAIAQVQSDVDALEQMPEVKAIKKKSAKKETLIHKFFKNLRKNGIKVALKKVWWKLTGKL